MSLARHFPIKIVLTLPVFLKALQPLIQTPLRIADSLDYCRC
jgi:hypothetical protein